MTVTRSIADYRVQTTFCDMGLMAVYNYLMNKKVIITFIDKPIRLNTNIEIIINRRTTILDSFCSFSKCGISESKYIRQTLLLHSPQLSFQTPEAFALLGTTITMARSADHDATIIRLSCRVAGSNSPSEF